MKLTEMEAPYGSRVKHLSLEDWFSNLGQIHLQLLLTIKKTLWDEKHEPYSSMYDGLSAAF